MKYFAKHISNKVNLSLCSRDIQVGDKWLLTDGDGVTGSNIRKEDDKWSPLMQKNAYKVIGEISPEAIWVKEGDEFGEEDLYFLTTRSIIIDIPFDKELLKDRELFEKGIWVIGIKKQGA